MSFSVFKNIVGTLSNTFKIGKFGPTIKYGSTNPNVDQVSGNIGDFYLETSFGLMFQKQSSGWFQLSKAGYLSKKVIVTTSTYEVSSDDHYIGVNRNNPVDIFLLNGIAMKQLIIKDEGGYASSGKEITIHSASGEMIDGSSTFVMDSPKSSITICYSEGWQII